MRRLKLLFFTCFYICIMKGMAACQPDDKTLLKGRWEMPVSDNLTYIIEINMNEPPAYSRPYEPDEPNVYGYMDFSNLHHFYQYTIDSVAALGDNRYVIRSTDKSLSLMFPNYTPDIDTLRYLPQTGELIYDRGNDIGWIFSPVPTGVLEGEWEDTFPEGYEYACLSLYRKVYAPEGDPYYGKECYGWITYSTDVGDAYRLITEVKQINEYQAIITTVFADYPEEEPQEHTLTYNPEDSTLTYDNTLMQPINKQSICPF